MTKKKTTKKKSTKKKPTTKPEPKSKKKTSNRKSFTKDGCRCATCKTYVDDPSAHANEHRTKWKKKHPKKFPIPSVRFLIIEDGEQVGYKLL